MAADVGRASSQFSSSNWLLSMRFDGPGQGPIRMLNVRRNRR